MTKKNINIYPIFVLVVLLTACITPFAPKGITVEQVSLVIDGDIILNDNTKVFLSFLQTIDSYGINYITDATVWVEDTQERRYAGSVVSETNKPPYYLIDTKTCSFTQQYKLCVTYDGKQYETDFLTPLATPEIDDLGFIVHDTKAAVDFYVTTYGNDQISPYYKWTYTEDWEIVSAYPTNVFFDHLNYYDANHGFRQYPTEYPLLYCWGQSTVNPPVIAKTDHLQENIVYQQRVNTIHDRDDRIGYLYTMELVQMCISKDAFTYWSVIMRNTDEVGGIFAPQPSELYGNIRCVSNPELRTLGYISAGIRSVKRIFVTAKEIGIYDPPSCLPVNLAYYPDYPHAPYPQDCDFYYWGDRVASQSLIDVLEERASRTIKWLPKTCVDCTTRGSKNKPSFWPNDHQ